MGNIRKYNVFDVQNACSTEGEIVAFLKQLSLEEVSYLISTCGTPQGKLHYYNLAKGILKNYEY